MELKEKLYLVDSEGDKFMGAGVLWLLEAIESTSSLRKAASEMGLSYSKAYMMIDRLEKNLGRQIVIRRHGGADRVGASLTPFAIEFMKLFKEFQVRMKAHADDEYQVFMKELESLQEETDGK